MAWQGSKNAPSASQTATTEPSTGDTAVNVQVGGVKLALRSDKDPKLVQSIATYLDSKVGDIRSQAPGVPLDKALILASLTVAEELFDAQARVRVLENSLRERIDNCLAMLDELEADPH